MNENNFNSKLLETGLVDALYNLYSAYPSVFVSVAKTITDVANTTMDTYFIYFVRDLLKRYKKLTTKETRKRYKEHKLKIP